MNEPSSVLSNLLGRVVIQFNLGQYHNVIQLIEDDRAVKGGEIDSIECYYWLGWSYYNINQKAQALDALLSYVIQFVHANQNDTTFMQQGLQDFLSDFEGKRAPDAKCKEEFVCSILKNRNMLEIFLRHPGLFKLFFYELKTPGVFEGYINFLFQNPVFTMLFLLDERYLEIKNEVFKKIEMSADQKDFFQQFNQSKNILGHSLVTEICRRIFNEENEYPKTQYYLLLIYRLFRTEDISQWRYIKISILNAIFDDIIVPIAYVLDKPIFLSYCFSIIGKDILSPEHYLRDWVPLWFANGYDEVIKDYFLLLKKSVENNEDSDSEDEIDSVYFDFFVCIINNIIIQKDNPTACLKFVLKTFYDVSQDFFRAWSEKDGSLHDDSHFLYSALHTQYSAELFRCLCESFRQLPAQQGKSPLLISRFRDKDGKIILHHAAEKNKLKIVDLLLNQRITGDESTIGDFQDRLGNTPLHYACYNGNYAIIQLLIQSGASLEHRNIKGETPLKILLKQGAALTKRDDNQKNMLDYLPALEKFVRSEVVMRLRRVIQSSSAAQKDTPQPSLSISPVPLLLFPSPPTKAHYFQQFASNSTGLIEMTDRVPFRTSNTTSISTSEVSDPSHSEKRENSEMDVKDIMFQNSFQ